MNLKKEERTCLFIDGSSLYSTSRGLGFDVDYKKLLDFFTSKTHIIRAYYYAAILDTEDYSPLKPLTDWLSYNGYFLVTKPAREFTDSTGKRRVKGNMEIEIAVDMMEMAPHIDHAILFTGDSDFRRVVEAVQRQGTRVSVVSSMRSSPPLIGDDLRRQADNFMELATIASNFTRRQQTETQRPRTGAAPAPIRHPADQMSEPDLDEDDLL
ncbi:LabA-like NYN domain-containing protein [Acetobacter persici]|uniref:LabA-like NYN domain-containing protein n=1 Tax=Acetobacter persici TaxID=1076596 RepID=UPI001F1CE4C6|nr:NYN domain-containing protein [Acetobacter persici]MCG0998611.1 NYN domain-containing protein [Acetobacter persici]